MARKKEIITFLGKDDPGLKRLIAIYTRRSAHGRRAMLAHGAAIEKIDDELRESHRKAAAKRHEEE